MKYYETLVFNTYGEVPEARGLTAERKFKGYYCIQYNHAGPVWVERGNEPRCEAEGPHAFFTFPGPLFRYGAPEGQGRHHCFVGFSGTLIRRFMAGGLLDLKRRNPLIQVVNGEQFYASLKRLHRLLDQPGGALQARAAWLLEDLLLQLQEQPGARLRINAFCEQEIKRLRQAMVEHPLQDWNFAFEAQNLNVSYSHFRRMFREIVGCAPNQFLIEIRLNHASKLLEGTDLTVAEIAHECGFPDEYYFSRLFKKHRFITPSAIRGMV